MSDKPKLGIEEIRKLMQDFGLAKDAQRMQILQEIFNPKIPTRLSIIPTKNHVIHLNYMKGLEEVIGGNVGAFIKSLHDGEIDHLYALKGMSLEKFTDILQNQQNAQDITVRNESIPQQLTEKRGFWSRVTGGNKQE